MSSYSSPGLMLKNNMMNGQPTRMRSYPDYTGMVIPPCGDFAQGSSSSTRAPWLDLKSDTTTSGRSGQRLSLLHEEITRFTNYMSPSREEVALRADLVARFTKLVERLVPYATVSPVGSYITKLYFPTSDIDMVMSFQSLRFLSTTSELQMLEYEIRRSNFASNVRSVLHASTPLLRITDAKTGLDIDLTADDGHGKRATRAVSSWLEQEDSATIKSLVMVLKMFLSMRRLGTTYTGGINSYVLVWMVAAYVKLEISGQASDPIDAITTRMSSLYMAHRPSDTARRATLTPARASQSSVVDLGDALLGFLRFYGQDFGYTYESIQFTANSVCRSSKPSSSYWSSGRYRAPTARYLLHIIDPADPSVDMGSKAYGIKHVQETFKDAYVALKSSVQGNAVGKRDKGILGGFLGGSFTSFVLERRRISRTWKTLS